MRSLASCNERGWGTNSCFSPTPLPLDVAVVVCWVNIIVVLFRILSLGFPLVRGGGWLFPGPYI